MTIPPIPTNPIETFSPFLPATYTVPEEEDRRRTFLVDNLSSISDVVNDKKIGSYVQAAENQNGEKWFYKSTKVTRNGYQTIAYIPSLPNNTTLTLTRDTTPQFPLQDVTTEFVITMSYGTASRPPTATNAGNGDFFTFMNKGDPRVSWNMSDIALTITSTTDLSAYSGFIVIHYLRNGI
jgi:hypothetical protein